MRKPDLGQVLNELWSEKLAEQMSGMFQAGYQKKKPTEKDLANFLMDSTSSSHPVLAFCMWCGGEFHQGKIEEHESECGS